MFEAQLLVGIKKEFGITTSKHDKTIKILIKKYIKREISKKEMEDILICFHN